MMRETGQNGVLAEGVPRLRKRKQRPFFLKREGFSLTEVVVASAIIMLVFGALIGSFTYARRSVALTEERLVCLHIARQAMESLRTHSFTSSELAVGIGKTLPGFPGDRGHYDVTLEANGKTKNITVVVDWVAPWGLSQSVSLTTSMSESLHK